MGNLDQNIVLKRFISNPDPSQPERHRHEIVTNPPHVSGQFSTFNEMVIPICGHIRGNNIASVPVAARREPQETGAARDETSLLGNA
jgi:hypothetical protein